MPSVHMPNANIILDNGAGAPATPADPGRYLGYGGLGVGIDSQAVRIYGGGVGDPNGILTAPGGSLWIEIAGPIWQNFTGAADWRPLVGGINGAALQRISTTDGVVGGSVRVIGGRVFFQPLFPISDVIASAGAGAFQDFPTNYTVPANTIKSGTIIRCQVRVRVYNGSGANTLSLRLSFGGVVLATTTAVLSTTVGDFQLMEVTLTNPDTTGGVTLSGMGSWDTDAAGVQVHRAISVSPPITTTVPNTFQLAAQWSGVTPGTAVRLHTFNVDMEG